MQYTHAGHTIGDDDDDEADAVAVFPLADDAAAAAPDTFSASLPPPAAACGIASVADAPAVSDAPASLCASEVENEVEDAEDTDAQGVALGVRSIGVPA